MNETTFNHQELSASDIEAKSNLTRSQFLIWIGQQMSPDQPIYNMGWRFKLGLDVDPVRFAQAIEALVRAVDTLRMTFQLDGDVPRFVVDDAAAGQHETCSVTEQTRAEIVERTVKTPFDLARETFRSLLLHVDGKHWEWVIVQHHIVTDAASAEILLATLSEAYQKPGGVFLSVDEAPPSYVSWALADDGTQKSADEGFWRKKLEDLPEPPIPYGGENTGQTARATSVYIEISGERLEKLRAALETDRFAALTPDQAQFNFFATASFAWLHRISGQDRLAVGMTLHNRASTATKATAGLFMEALPLSAEITPEMSLAGLHAEIVENAGQLLMHASPGLSSAATHAKFNVFLNYLTAKFGAFAGYPVEAEWLDKGHVNPSDTLWMNVLGFGSANRVMLQLVLNTGFICKDLRDRVATQMLRCIDALLDTPEAKLSHIAIASDIDQSTLLTHADPWANPKDVTDVCIAFSNHASETPDAIAVIDNTGQYTRAELDDFSDRVAHFLLQKGIGRGDRVGLYLTRGMEYIACVLGVLKCGAAYVPLDPLQPPARLETIAQSGRLAMTLTEQRLLAKAPDIDPLVLVETIPTDPTTAVQVDFDPEDDAYVIFTSGSTGTPKGVRIPRQALARYVTYAAREYGGLSPATWPLYSAIGFDMTVTLTFAPLVSGGVIRAYRDPPEGTDLSVLEVFTDDAVDVVKMTPAHLSLVCREGKPVKRIKTLVVGGEKVTTGVARDALETLGEHLAFYNLYGPTEATVGCMLHRFDPAQDTGFSIPIGRAADETAIYILDQGLNPVPDHTRGEIYVAGPDRLAKGYLGLDTETQARFVANPFKDGTLMYQTGDLAHIDTRGVIHYEGRSDDQIKVGGVRVEPAEIRKAVLSYPNVADCTVTVDKSEGKAPRISCFIVTAGALEADDLRAHLARHLPRAIIPSSLRAVPKIPLTPNGKVDRSALEAISSELQGATHRATQMPANETERTLLDIWHAVLDRNDFGPNDNFFDVGGDSLHAISIASRAGRAGLSVTALAVLTKQTVSAIAADISPKSATGVQSSASKATLDRKSMDRLGALFGKKRDG